MAKIKCPFCGTKYEGTACPTCAGVAPQVPQKKKNKWLLPVLIVLVIFLAVACVGGNEEAPKEPANVQGDSSVTSPVREEKQPAQEQPTEAAEPAKAEVTLAETEIYNADGIVVKVTGMGESIFGTELHFDVSNESNKNVAISTRALSVNGYMMDLSGLYCDVAAGKKAKESVTLYRSELDQAGIETVADVAFYIHISDSSSFMTITDSDLITVSTSASGSYVQPVDDSGDVLYDAGGIRVVCKGLKQDLIWDGSVVFYMENNSGQPVTISSENVSVNGYMVNASLWADLRAETRCIDGMVILDLNNIDLDSIDEVENIEFNLKIINSDNWSSITSTDVIKLEF